MKFLNFIDDEAPPRKPNDIGFVMSPMKAVTDGDSPVPKNTQLKKGKRITEKVREGVSHQLKLIPTENISEQRQLENPEECLSSKKPIRFNGRARSQTAHKNDAYLPTQLRGS